MKSSIRLILFAFLVALVLSFASCDNDKDDDYYYDKEAESGGNSLPQTLSQLWDRLHKNEKYYGIYGTLVFLFGHTNFDETKNALMDTTLIQKCFFIIVVSGDFFGLQYMVKYLSYVNDLYAVGGLVAVEIFTPIIVNSVLDFLNPDKNERYEQLEILKTFKEKFQNSELFKPITEMVKKEESMSRSISYFGIALGCANLISILYNTSIVWCQWNLWTTYILIIVFALIFIIVHHAFFATMLDMMVLRYAGIDSLDKLLDFIKENPLLSFVHLFVISLRNYWVLFSFSFLSFLKPLANHWKWIRDNDIVTYAGFFVSGYYLFDNVFYPIDREDKYLTLKQVMYVRDIVIMPFIVFMRYLFDIRITRVEEEECMDFEEEALVDSSKQGSTNTTVSQKPVSTNTTLSQKHAPANTTERQKSLSANLRDLDTMYAYSVARHGFGIESAPEKSAEYSSTSTNENSGSFLSGLRSFIISINEVAKSVAVKGLPYAQGSKLRTLDYLFDTSSTQPAKTSAKEEEKPTKKLNKAVPAQHVEKKQEKMQQIEKKQDKPADIETSGSYVTSALSALCVFAPITAFVVLLN